MAHTSRISACIAQTIESYKNTKTSTKNYQFSVRAPLYIQSTEKLEKMKYIVVFAALFAVAIAAPADPKDATIVRYENDNIGVEGYKFA